MGIHAKILEIQKTIEVKKTGYDDRNDFFYYKAEDVLRDVRDALNKQGVITQVLIKEHETDNFFDSNGRGRPRTTIVGKVNYIDAESGEVFETEAVATGSDVGSDKGPRKAHTQLKKISFLDTFLLTEGIEKFDTDGQPEQEPINNSAPAEKPLNASELKAKIGDIVRDESNPITGPDVNNVGNRVARELGIEEAPAAWMKSEAVMQKVLAHILAGEIE